jgi:Na+-driven multidrug efflux pump
MEKMATGERWQPQQLLQVHDGELDRQRSGGDAKPIEDEDSSGSFGRVRSNIATIVAFSLPVLLVPLADPIMSLVDTIFLGQFAGTVQLAALSPCTLIFNFTFYSFTALTIATVSIVAEHLRSQREDLAGKALSTSLVIGAIGGACITLVLTTYGSLLLSLTGCDPVLLPVAEKYLRIRAFAAPAAILTSVLQGSFLAQRDSRTPFKVVVSSILLSALGDVILLYRFRFGVVGAAWTTLASQCFSASVLMYHACKSRVKPSIVLPSLSEVFALLRYVSTLGVFYVAKTSSYLFLQI